MTCWQRLPPIRSCNARRTSAAVFPGCFPSTLRQPVWDPSRDTLLPSQERALDQRCRALAPIAEGGLFRRLALVPARGLAQPGWFTSMFLHFGWLHFLGNMVFLLFVGRFLEDRWGRLFFAVFYVAGGVAAAVAHAGDAGGMIDVDRAAPLTAHFQVNVNQADWPELMQLPGVGRTLAERLIAEREERGEFQSVEELTRVDGIGPRTIERIRPYLLPIADERDVARR